MVDENHLKSPYSTTEYYKLKKARLTTAQQSKKWELDKRHQRELETLEREEAASRSQISKLGKGNNKKATSHSRNRKSTSGLSLNKSKDDNLSQKTAKSNGAKSEAGGVTLKSTLPSEANLKTATTNVTKGSTTS